MVRHLSIIKALLSWGCITPIMLCGQSISGIINDYAKVTEVQSCPPMVKLDTATAFSVGDLVLLIQMNGAMIDTSNTPSFGQIVDIRSAGLYEYGRIDSIDGTHVFFENLIVNSYDPGNASVQLIRVPEYTNTTVTGKLTCKAWNGNVGGVLTFFVYNTLTLSDTVDVSGKGFSGGIAVNVDWQCDKEDFFYATPDENGAEKGRGIGHVSADKRYGKGAPANGGGGGNSTNTGGGGGALGGAGGHGGYQWGRNNYGCHASDPDPETTPGRGGHELTAYLQNRTFMGGGGGAGDANNQALSDGGAGGGIIMIEANNIVSNGNVIRANGTQGIDPGLLGNDGGGGGGAGGLIWIEANSHTGTLFLEANGGRGANVRSQSGYHGPGGGAGGGIIRWPGALTSPSVSMQVQKGISGVLVNITNPIPFGAEDGFDGNTESTPGFIFQQDTLASPPNSSPVIQYACPGDTLTLNPLTSAQVTWYPHPLLGCTQCQNPVVAVDSSDLVFPYYYKDSCGLTYEDTVSVIVDTGNTVPTNPVTVSACPGDTIVLQPGTNVQITWYPDTSLSCTQCQNPTVIVGNSENTFTYYFANSCGKTYEDVVQVNLKSDCIDTPCTVIKLPNAFTPNGDGLNDEFKVLTDRPDDAVVSSFRIYNRWGELIFESNDLAIGWDGTYRDEPAESGVYTWVCKGRCAEGTFLEYGNVTLIR